ncbi:unnamed protein product [Soboliphyme baturini]|uniref:DNA polymerase epsilon catalytic subunit n=1 Tax=Soboliphyme baturini TaxID=241478 RepID=A0A183J8H8_9BILA|nr:unnamed protein product [Soboliphyme baturini]
MNTAGLGFEPANFLCDKAFQLLVAGYIALVHKYVTSILSEESFVMPDVAASQVSTGDTTDSVQQSLKSYCQHLIKDELTIKLYSTVQKIQKKVSATITEGGIKMLFPRFPGSHLKLNNPGLEFSKAICKVLSLDENIRDEVERLRRDLLKLVGVSEFASEAEWKDPCMSYILSEVLYFFKIICKHCHECRDIDLCRDHSIFCETEAMTIWRCPGCGGEYDLKEIECLLLQDLNKLMVTFCLQDLRCIKCQEVFVANSTEALRP